MVECLALCFYGCEKPSFLLEVSDTEKSCDTLGDVDEPVGLVENEETLGTSSAEHLHLLMLLLLVLREGEHESGG